MSTYRQSLSADLIGTKMSFTFQHPVLFQIANHSVEIALLVLITGALCTGEKQEWKRVVGKKVG